MDPTIERRILFLIDAAKFEEKRDQVVTYAMRVLSNHAAIGKDGGSREIKQLNRRVSAEARKLLMSVDIDTYCKETINEHPKPLKETWDWLRKNAHSLSKEEVWAEFQNNPMVTITKKEDEGIRERGQNSTGDMQSRYLDQGIDIVHLDRSPKELSPS